jgi:23S rRNA (pseudouridine1915-N3)-methyltransferase
MRVIVGAVGRPRCRDVAGAIERYEARAARYWPLEVCEVREESARAVSADRVREREGERLLARLPPGARLVVCDAEGEQMTSRQFAVWLQSERERAGPDVAFLIGGAYGHSPRVRAAAATLLSFARWTLPHEIARLVLAEQLYRAGTIARGEPYHK